MKELVPSGPFCCLVLRCLVLLNGKGVVLFTGTDEKGPRLYMPLLTYEAYRDFCEAKRSERRNGGEL